MYIGVITYVSSSWKAPTSVLVLQNTKVSSCGESTAKSKVELELANEERLN